MSDFRYPANKVKWWIAFTLVGASGPPLRVLAHPGQPIAPHDLWSSWNLNVFLILTMELGIFIYVIGVRAAWRRTGAGRSTTIRRSMAFAGAMLALVVALISPLDALSGALFSAHMIQHLILILVAAPLMALSNFPVVLLWALPRRTAQALGRGWNRATGLQRLWHLITSPACSWLLFGVTLWIWHAPTFYEAALRDETIHAFEHVILLFSAMLFWWSLLDTSRPKFVRYGIAIPYLFTTALHSGVLGALMTFTSEPWYAYYATSVAAWGITPLQDQQLAGLVMWVPGGAVFTLLAIAYFGAWLRVLDQRTVQRNPPRSSNVLKRAHDD